MSYVGRYIGPMSYVGPMSVAMLVVVSDGDVQQSMTVLWCGWFLSLNVGPGRVVSLLTRSLCSIPNTFSAQHPSPLSSLSSYQSHREPVVEIRSKNVL